MMLKRTLISLVLIVSSVAVSASDAADRLLSVQNYLKSLGKYAVGFSVDLNKGTVHGRYSVSGDDFFLSMDFLEVYVHNGIRYEVNNDKKEITIDSASLSADDILSRPTLDFASLLEKYDASLSQRVGSDTVILTSKKGGKSGETVHVVIPHGSKAPSEIDYVTRNGFVKVHLDEPKKVDEDVLLFNPSRYSDYEVFDLR